MKITPIEAEATPFREPHPAGKSTIHGLQALRFVAAAMVVITHVLNREVNLYHPYPLPRAPWMEAGVDIFFVISGFIMVYIIKPDTRPGPFWLQRFTRIAPLYWVATAVAFIGGLVLPDWVFGRADWVFALKSALFLPITPDVNDHPLVSPGWTLIFEFSFYTLLALCLTIRRPPFRLAAIAIAVILLAALFRGAVPWLGYYSSGLLMLEFLFGMIVAELVRRFPVRPWLGMVLALGGLVLIYFMWEGPFGTARGLNAGLPALLVVFGILASEPIWQRHAGLRWFARLGDASYSIYIVHFFFVTAIAVLFSRSEAVRDGFGPYGYTVVSVAVGIGAGIAVHIFVEKPLLQLVRSWLPRRRHRPELSPAKV
jgi:peptidoglycan/LPS O-acetylase OafA/YrhL